MNRIVHRRAGPLAIGVVANGGERAVDERVIDGGGLRRRRRWGSLAPGVASDGFARQ